MLIIVRDNENNRSKRNAKNKQTNKVGKQQGGRYLVKVWELNGFVVHLS